LSSLFENISGAKVFLVFTYRPEFEPPWEMGSYHHKLTLNKLPNPESLALITHILGVDGIERDLEELIMEKSEGIPLFIEEFIKSLDHLKIIEKKGNRYFLKKDHQEMVIPSTIQDVIMARVDTLSEGSKRVIQTASVIEREFSYELIKRLLGLSEQQLLSHLSELNSAELLQEKGRYPHSIYFFKHALTREVVYDSMLTSKKSELHEKVGNSIEELYLDRLEGFYEILAYQYSKSDNFEKAYHYLKRSAQKASRNYSLWEAFRYYREAINVLTRFPESYEKKKEEIEVQTSPNNLRYRPIFWTLFGACPTS
jgi:predicted ATPase